MADFNYQSTIGKEDQFLIIDSVQIPGVQNISMGYTNPTSPLKHLGMKNTNHLFNGQRVGKVDISTFLFSSDYFINYTGDLGANGGLFQKASKNGLYFSSGYLTSYSSSYSLSSPPQIDASFAVFGELGKSNSPNLTTFFNLIETQHPKLKTVGPGSINFQNSVFETNRVQSYSINISPNRIPIYPLGNISPSEVKLSYPFEINCSFDLEINDYQFKNLNKYPNTQTLTPINLQINDFFTAENICNYSFGDMLLVGENVVASSDSNVKLRLDYQLFKI